MHAKLVAYECIAAAHQPSLIHPDKLTIHAGRWAFCPFDARANDHEWHDTGGADLEAMYRQFGLPMVSARSDAAHATAS